MIKGSIMRLALTYFTSTVFVILFSVEGQAATFNNTIPIQLLNSTYYYDFYQSKNFYNSETRTVEKTVTESKSETTFEPFSQSMLTGQESPVINLYSSYSKAKADLFTIDASSSSWGGPNGGTGYGYSFATGTWQFQALTNEALTYRLGGGFPWDAEFILLTDLTTNQKVYSIENVAFLKNFLSHNNIADRWKGAAETVNWYIYSDDQIMENILISGHIYQLDMGVLVQSSNDHWFGSVSANLKAVPIPLPFWLFATGLGFISKRRFQKLELIKK
jgi:hypothetical protein